MAQRSPAAPAASSGAGTVRVALRAAGHLDWTQFEGLAALRCTAGVAIVLAAGLAAHEPAISAFGAIGAVSVGFGSFQGAYRSRAAVMVYAAVGMALAVLAGSLTGSIAAGVVVSAGATAFLGGLLVALGPAAAFVGLQCVVAVIIAGGFPADVRGAAGRAALVLGGGLVQTLLVVVIWPLRRFPAERAALSTAYRSLAAYAAAIPGGVLAAPEPHTFAGTASPLRDPQPFARVGEVLVFQALLDEAERIRASLAALATHRPRLAAANAARADQLAGAAARVLDEVAAALDEGRAPVEVAPLWAPLDACVSALPPTPAIDGLLGQMRSAWQTAAVPTATMRRPPAASGRCAAERRCAMA